MQVQPEKDKEIKEQIDLYIHSQEASSHNNVIFKKELFSIPEENVNPRYENKSNEIVLSQSINNYSIKSRQPLCMKSMDQESYDRIEVSPTINEAKRTETNSDYCSQRNFITGRFENTPGTIDPDDNTFISNYLKKCDKPQFLSYLINPVLKGIWIRGYIKKEKTENSLTYYYCLSDTHEVLMIITKETKKKYVIYTNFNNQGGELLDLGKLRKNFLGTTFSLETTSSDVELPKINIHYNLNVMGVIGPMELNVKIPLKNGVDYTALVNKKPVYSERHKCYVLDYINRKLKSSVKNFQLVKKEDNKPKTVNDICDEEDKETIILQFGEVVDDQDNCYLLDFKFPLSPLQSVAIAVSNLHNKLLCE